MKFSASRRKLLCATASSALLSAAVPSFAVTNNSASITILEAINQAGRQRMLSQRMAKLYAEKLLEVDVFNAQKFLTASIARFEQQLDTLTRFTDNKAMQHINLLYKKQAADWAQYRALLVELPGTEQLNRIVVLNETILATAHEATVALEKHHGGSLGRLVNISGRQRMLSQRMAKFYFFWRKGLAGDDMRKKLGAARQEFLSALAILEAAPENTPETRHWLEMARAQWPFFNDALTKIPTKTQQPEFDRNVASASENILQIMDALTNLYAIQQ